MLDFLSSSELWANILGGVVAGALIAVVTGLRERNKNKIRERNKNKILEDLMALRARAIEQTNLLSAKRITDEHKWLEDAKNLEGAAIATAKKLSPAAGSYLDWLGPVPVPRADGEIGRYDAILRALSDRIKTLMEQRLY